MAIFFDNKTKHFYLEGKGISYVFCVNDANYLEHLYFGKKIDRDDLTYQRTRGTYFARISTPGNDFPDDDSLLAYDEMQSELTFFGNGSYAEPTVHALMADGERITELLYDSFEILSEKPKPCGMPGFRGGETLVVHLKDKVNGFGADLYYTVYEDCDTISRRIIYKNGTSADVSLQRAYSFCVTLPKNDYELMTLHGGWAAERQIDKVKLHHGVMSVDSKRSHTSPILDPFMALMSDGATEALGEVYGFALIYSSSYVMKTEKRPDGTVNILGGINDFDFGWKLAAGESFDTPEVAITFSDNGIGGMSRNFHKAFRNHLINPRFVNKARPIVINNWEATYFDFDVPKLKAIVDAVEGTGIDTFVLDDGWFGARVDSDTAGLGDWVVNTDKLEGGLKAITDYIHSKGMKFGLWFEPEMVNEDSELFRVHPDYAVGIPSRKPALSRHQRVLDITRAEVRDYIVNSINKVLSENDIDYVKWDCNRTLTEYYSIGRDVDRQQEFAHRYALGLYDLCERIIEANPNIFFEGCSGGGGRFDGGMLYYFPQIWTSDDTDANERARIQYGTSIIYPPSSISCHVSICPNHQTERTTPFMTRADIAHMGPTGYELDTTTFDDAQKAQVKAQIAEYNSMRDLVIDGDLYRIDNPQYGNFASWMLVSSDKARAYLTCYRRMGGVNNQVKLVRLCGLESNTKYFVKELGVTASGSTLMNVGIAPKFPKGDFLTLTYHIEKI